MNKFVVVLVVIGGLAMLWNRRRNAKPKTSIDKVMHTVRKSDLPEWTKERILTALDEAREGLTVLRETAGQMAKRAS